MDDSRGDKDDIVNGDGNITASASVTATATATATATSAISGNDVPVEQGEDSDYDSLFGNDDDDDDGDDGDDGDGDGDGDGDDESSSVLDAKVKSPPATSKTNADNLSSQLPLPLPPQTSSSIQPTSSQSQSPALASASESASASASASIQATESNNNTHVQDSREDEDEGGYDSMFDDKSSDEDDDDDNNDNDGDPINASISASLSASTSTSTSIHNHLNQEHDTHAAIAAAPVPTPPTALAAAAATATATVLASSTSNTNANANANANAGDSSEEDFDEMFGDESEDEDEDGDVEIVQNVDLQKTSIPRRKRKHTSIGKGGIGNGNGSNSGNLLDREEKGDGTANGDGNGNGNVSTFTGQLAAKRMKVSARRRPDQYKQFGMDDFWRALRSWDFVTELNQNMKREGGGASGSTSTSTSQVDGDGNSNDPNAQSQSQALPDQFHCAEEYISRWAPLQIKETKAQILSEVSSNRSSGGISYQKLTVPVTVTPNKEGRDDSYSECLVLKISSRSINGNGNGNNGNGNIHGHGHGSSRSNGRNNSGSGQFEFMQNDLVLLLCDSSICETACKGKLRPPDKKSSYSMTSLLSMHSPFVEGRLGIVGTVLNRCKSLDALTVKIAKRLWKPSSMGVTDLFLLRLGSNVTAIREFRALCGLKDMPLSKYILSAQHEANSSGVAKNPLSQFGGSNALGIGFRIFVKSKFNTSQQAAISAAAREYGDGGFTLVKGPPGTGKTTTLVALLNALHLRQYQRYYTSIEGITLAAKAASQTESLAAISAAAKVLPRILVCAPSNAAVDNVILKILEERFMDGNGTKYSPSIIRIGSGQSSAVASVALGERVNKIIGQGANPTHLESVIQDNRKELKRLQREIRNLQIRVRLIANATSEYSLSRDWEIRVDEDNFEKNQRVMFVNHKTKKVQLICPPKPSSGEELYPTDQMPHYRGCMSSLVKYIERHNYLHSKLLQLIQVQNFSNELSNSNRNQLNMELNHNLETNILDSTHIVMTTLGSSGSRTLEGINQFSVIVIDEAAQSCEPSMLPALQLGSSHCVLVGDPQQLPATIFSMSGRSTKYDRSLFQRLEEAGHHVYMLNTQYRMHPMISSFPRRIFYDGSLIDGPNVSKADYGSDVNLMVRSHFVYFKALTILDVDSAEEREGTSLSNKTEAYLALHLYSALRDIAKVKARVAIITPYQQQIALLRRTFQEKYGLTYSKFVDISTIDSFQGKESSIVILSCVRASPEGGGIGFLSDVQRMNVALTRAKHFLFIIANCRSIVVNPYWRDLVEHAKERGAVIKVSPRINDGLRQIAQGRGGRNSGNRGRGSAERLEMFPDLGKLLPIQPSRLQHFHP